MNNFDDDELDGLNDTTLQELENNAIQFTQAQKPSQAQAAASQDATLNEYDFEDDDLDDAVVIDEAAQLPLRHSVERQLPQRPRAAPTIPSPQQRWNQSSRPKPPALAHRQVPAVPSVARPSFSSAYPSQLQQVRPLGPSRQGIPPASSRYVGHPLLPPPPGSHRSTYQPRLPPPQNQATTTPQNHNDIIASLTARLHALEAEVTSAKGETAIVRSKYERSITSHESEVAKLKKQNAEALAKQERRVEVAIQAEKAAATELEFTRQDLKDELQKTRKNRRENDGLATPKKNKSAGWGNIADGFDDVEILPSPGRGQAGPRSKGKTGTTGVLAPGERTPSKLKRKRPIIESPVKALEVEDDVVMADAADAAPGEASSAAPGPDALPYDFLRIILDHSAYHGQPLTFDVFARYGFPSNPAQSFSSIIFQKLPSLGDPSDPMRLLVDFCELLMDIWMQCLTEKYYEPVYDLVALITYTLQLNTVSVAPFIISTLIPVAQTTIYLVGVPRFESLDGDLANHPDELVQQLFLNIDSLGILQVMHLAALGCIDSYLLDPQQPLHLGAAGDTPQTLFWKLLQPDFVLMMLSPKQPPEEFLGMLSLLCASCLEDSIGPISSDPQKDPVFVARALIDKITHIMSETPQWASEGNFRGSFSHRQCIVRLAALKTLMAFSQSPFGAVQLALSDVAIPRLVAVLCAAVDALYDMDAPTSLFLDQFSSTEPEDEEPKPADSENGHTDTALVAQDATADASNDNQTAPGENVASKSALPPLSDEVAPDPTPLLYRIIPSITLFLHTLITDPATSTQANMPAKITTSHGGSQRYLLTLSRLTFAEEDLVLEAGIDTGTVDKARELLELSVTPDEGDSVGEVFGL